jgi:hypothetical protein
MEFTNNTEKKFDAYGYQFFPGIPVDVKEESLINKFKLYETLTCGEIILEEKTEEPTEVGIELLRSQAIGLGMKVDGRWKEERLRQEIARYGDEG